MSTLTTIKILTDGQFHHVAPRPLIRFYGRVQSYSVITGVLLIQELPAFMVSFDESQPAVADSLPCINLLVPPTGLEITNDTIRQQLVVSIMGYLEADLAVTAHSVEPLANQQLFDLGYSEDKYSSTVLEKIQVTQHIAKYG